MIPSEVWAKIKINKGQHEFIPTGFPKLDACLDGGLLRKELVVIGGSTGAGKSYFAIHLADKASTAGFKVGYFSLEISSELVIARMIGMKSRIKSSHILYGAYDSGNIELNKSIGHVLGHGELLHVSDDIYELQVIERKIKENKLEFVVIDFIQNIITSRLDEYERLSHVSLQLQKIAKEANCCIVVLSQLSNVVAKEGIENKSLEYKGSGSIATVADLGFVLAKNTDGLTIEENTEQYFLKLLKNRRGPSSVMTQLLVRWPGGSFYEN